jgi:predicted phosphodiesterase
MTTPVALISDIHGNLDALQVVLADIKRRSIPATLCLGDIIGYGPNPKECLDLIMENCQWSLMGNHDFAVLYEPTSFNASAEAAAYWTRREIESEPDINKARKRWEYLGNLKIREKFNDTLCVHASPRRPINEYIFPDDVINNQPKLEAIFERFDARCFVGHTHVPGVFTNEPDFFQPTDLKDQTFHFKFGNGEKYIINPGSVGQPRDRDPRSSYAIITDEKVEFVRLDYNIQNVINKVKRIDELSDFLGLRLLEGR